MKSQPSASAALETARSFDAAGLGCEARQFVLGGLAGHGQRHVGRPVVTEHLDELNTAGCVLDQQPLNIEAAA